MTAEEARGILSAALRDVAPEADLAAADPDGLLQDELCLDSIDFINVVNAVYDRSGVGIPESDFPELSTFHSFVAYLVGKGRP